MSAAPMFEHVRAMSRVVAHRGRVFAVDHAAIVRFDPGRGAAVELLERERMFADLAVDDTHVYAAMINEDTILAIPHEGGEARVLASCSRPLSLTLRDGWLAWLDLPFVPDPVRGPPYSTTHTTIRGVSCKGGAAGSYASHAGSAWDLVVLGERVAWVRQIDGRPQIASLDAGAERVETLIEEFGDLDADGGFVHLAATAEHLIVAVPTRSWLRHGVELRRHAASGRMLERIAFVPGRFNGLHASEHGIALIVEHAGAVVARVWEGGGRPRTLSVARAPGPLVEPHVADDGAWFAVGSSVYRV